MREKNRIGFYAFGLLFLFASFSLGNLIARHQSNHLIIAFSSFFISYLFLLQKKNHWRALFLIGLLSRLVFFLALPILSDDVYRFIWDGILLKHEIHPFAELPSHYLTKPVDGLSPALYQKLNSPNYFTIYPPLNQALFWLSVQLGNDWLLNANILRVVFLSADVGSLLLLKGLLNLYNKDQNLAFWYFLNPLVILETTGNLHFEGLVVFFLLLGMYAYKRNKNWIAATGFGLAIGTKLLPVIYLPYLLFVNLKNKKWWIAIMAGIVGLLSFLPLLNETFIKGMSSSLELYFRKFEFNASLYFIAREIGFWMYGYNNIAKIGPLLSMLSTASILVVSGMAAHKKWKLPKAFLFILCVFILFSTIIHPWYIIPLIAFGLLSGFWFPVLWSFMVFLTYLGYTKTGYELPMWVIALEYLSVVIFGFIEIRRSSFT